MKSHRSVITLTLNTLNIAPCPQNLMFPIKLMRRVPIKSFRKTKEDHMRKECFQKHKNKDTI